MRLVTKGEFARERGVHPSRVTQWLRDGRLVEIEGRIDADAAHLALEARLDRTKGMRRDGNITSSAPRQTSAAATDTPRERSGDLAGHRAPDAGQGSAASLSRTPANERDSIPGAADRIAAGTSAPPNGGQLPLGAADADASKDGDAGKDADGGKSGEALPTSRDDTSYWAHKAKREEYEALNAQAKYFREAGALTHASTVRREAMETARALRNALEAIPDRVAPVLDPGNPARAHKLLLDEIRKALHEFSDRLGERAAAAGTGEPDSAVLQRVC